ncbi:MAG TPA: ABC transporter substrate-binding protein [Xanthobacteraceae bacterium]|nr:ABC transporter substrate-binding protein [Xanthobacteraceae bacterium]
MAKLKLSLAVGPYDRTRPLVDGSVQIDGVEAIGMLLTPEEMFFRAFRYREFDITELSLSSFTVKMAEGTCPYVGVPAFVSRAFRHSSIYVRTDRIKTPADLKGKKIGVPEYQLTACVWARAILEDDHGIKPSDVTWVRGPLEDDARPEKVSIKLPPDIRIEDTPDGVTITQLLADGAIDAFISPRAPQLDFRRHKNIGWLFPDPAAAARDYFTRSGVFPIMHVVGVRRDLVAQYPWLPAAVLKGFEEAKAMAVRLLSDSSASKATLPFVEESLKAARELMGDDFWPYGVAPNRKALDTFLRRHHAEGLSPRLVSVDELFHPSTYETFKL